MTPLARRQVLRGVLNGGAVSVALPLLNCFLDGNGTALASGAPLPVRFGTWHWGCGMNEKIFMPARHGPDFDLPEEIAALAPVRDKINIFSRFNVFTDSAPSLCHLTGWVVLRTGIPPMSTSDRPGETIDVTIAKQIGRSTRFQTLTASATGDVRNSLSYENRNSINAAESSPLTLYQHLFGADFQDPNGTNFAPNPRTMLRKSVLSGVMEEARELAQSVGAEDKARLDQFFTGLRELERQFDMQMTKPEPIAACHVPGPAKDTARGVEASLVAERHRLLTDLMVMAVACDQTRVFNMAYSASFAGTIKPGYDKPHHTTTHEEQIDPALGYQPNVSWYTRRAMESWSYFVEAFSKVKEGDGTLLDNVLIMAGSDHSLAKQHDLRGIPMFTAGRAGGRIRTGLHIAGNGGPGTGLGYTVQRVMGVDISSWGYKSNATSKEISEILA